MKNPHISIVTPVYACSACLPALYERIAKTLSPITDDFEIIMVNDYSPDNAWVVIKELACKDSRVKGMNLSRNFGQHQAITAGLDHAKGDWVVVMDCDLQDQPEEIAKLYQKAQEGYDIVFGRRAKRKDSFLKKISAKIFYKIYNYFIESKVDGTVANFSIASQKVIEAFRSFKEHTRSYHLMINLLGFKRTNIDIEHAKREDGKSSYTVSKLFSHALDSIISQSNKPLKVSIKIGFFLSLISFIYILWLVFRYTAFSVPLAGWTSVIVSIYFMGGLLIGFIGIVGLYIEKIYEESKNRPLYIIDETTWKE